MRVWCCVFCLCAQNAVTRVTLGEWDGDRVVVKRTQLPYDEEARARALREKDLADRLSALLQKARSGQRLREE